MAFKYPGLERGFRGGFPSSHSSLVTALATGTACQAGLGDPAFATALVLALVVMYDAMGVRRQAGMHATAINNLVTAFPSDHNFRNRGHGRGEDAAAPLEAGLMGNAGGGGYASGDTSEADGLLGGRSGRGNEANTGESIQDSLQRGFQDFLDQIQARPLREHIGHTPVQVLAGAILGVVVGATYAWALGDDILAGV